jgi:hypothetical protein
MRRTFGLFVIAVLTLATPGYAATITLDAGPMFSPNYDYGGMGSGRAFGFAADEDFTISSLGFDLGILQTDATLYRYDIFGSSNGHVADGALLASTTFTLAASTGYQDRALAFAFNAGDFYVINFRRVDGFALGDNLGTHYSWESINNTTFVPHDYGILTMLEGFEGATPNNSNPLIPWARMSYETAEVQPVPEPATLILLGSGLAGAAIRNRRRMVENAPERAGL